MNAMCAMKHDPLFDSRTLRNAFGCFPSGVAAVCALIDGEPTGMSVASFVPVSLDPALVLICIQKSSETWPKLASAPRIGVSVLGEEHNDACLQLASKTGDRFEKLEWFAACSGAVLLRGAAMSLDCSVAEEIDAGDHLLVMLKIEDLDFQPTVNPLVFHRSRFRQLATEIAASE